MTDALNVHIGTQLMRARLAKGLTIAQAAEALETSATIIEAYEMGALRISSGRLIRACDAFGVDPIYFFRDAELAQDGVPGGEEFARQ